MSPPSLYHCPGLGDQVRGNGLACEKQSSMGTRAQGNRVRGGESRYQRKAVPIAYLWCPSVRPPARNGQPESQLPLIKPSLTYTLGHLLRDLQGNVVEGRNPCSERPFLLGRWNRVSGVSFLVVPLLSMCKVTNQLPVDVQSLCIRSSVLCIQHRFSQNVNMAGRDGKVHMACVSLGRL